MALFVHDDHGHPLVHCKYHPGCVMFEFCKCLASYMIEVAVVVVLVVLLSV